MISILICSIRPNLLSSIKENIARTINVPYELLFHDNRTTQYGICKVYNMLLSQSKYKYAVFLHEDVIFQTQDWGTILLNYFESDKNIGLIGLAGARHKTKAPSGWWNNDGSELLMNIIQHYPDGKIVNHKPKSWPEKSLLEVCVVDGVFLAVRKENEISFNEKLAGFHNYDLALSIEYILAGMKVVISNEIILEHFSNGKIDKQWLWSTYNFSQIYQKHLPISLEKQNVTKSLEIKNTFTFIQLCILHKEYILAIKCWKLAFFRFPFSWQHLRVLKQLCKY